MKTIFSVIAAMLMLPFYTASAQTWQGLRWTNGNEMLVAEHLNVGQVLLMAGGFFDAGYGYLFNFEKTGAGSYSLTSAAKPTNMPYDKEGLAYMILSNETYNGDAKLSWKRKEVRGMDLLISYDHLGRMNSIYQQTSLDLREHAKDKIIEMFAGVYKDDQNRIWSFGDGDGICVWAGKATTYTMDDQLGAPDYYINVKGKLYGLELTMKGLDVYEARAEENEVFYKNVRKVATLTADNSIPRFADTSMYPCDAYAISLLNSNIIRLIRNEIYARKGWVFKDEQLNKYFRSLLWYRPNGDNSKIKLSEMELLNVSLLKYYENIEN